MKKFKQKQFSKNKKLAISIALIATLAALGAGAYFFFVKKDSNTAQNSSIESNQAERDETEDYKKQLESESTNQTSPSTVYEEDPNKTQEGSTAPTAPTSPAAATFGEISFSQNSGMVKASVPVQNPSGGNCNFIFSAQDERPVTKSVAVGPSDCAVEIPEIEFSYIGQWTLTINYGSLSKSTQVTIK